MKYQKRVSLLYCTLIFICSLLMARLYNLSKSETNKSMEVLDGQYTGKISVCERNGFVYDRGGNIISHKKSGKVLLVNPAEVADAYSCAKKLSEISIFSTASEIYEKIISGIPFTVAAEQNETIRQTDGIYVFDTYEEETAIAKHFLGYFDADGKGVCGLRGAYSDYLGKELYSKVTARFDTNAKRISLSPLDISTGKYLSSDGVVTTLDKDLQIFCDALKEEISSGAVVVADAKNGEILAMSSFPTFDKENIAEILNSSKGELVNRAVESFTPGSVFKVVVAAAAIEKDETLFDYKYCCEGKIEVEGNVFRCHKHSGHGEMDMQRAFAESCNTYFISLGKITGLSRIAGLCRKLGLDKALEADFISETRNFFPDENSESEGYLANISFGQGDLCFSPIDMTRIAIAVSTGYAVPLSTVKGEIRDGVFVADETGEKMRILDESTCQKMLAMMRKCVEEGTGKAGKVKGVNTGGKTATAQTGRFDKDGVEYVHKWFCGVYPAENPRISVCVLVDNETESNVSPSEVFGKICSFLLKKDMEK